jgi:phage antirepressor YoqD-like protein
MPQQVDIAERPVTPLEGSISRRRRQAKKERRAEEYQKTQVLIIFGSSARPKANKFDALAEEGSEPADKHQQVDIAERPETQLAGSISQRRRQAKKERRAEEYQKTQVLIIFGPSARPKANKFDALVEEKSNPRRKKVILWKVGIHQRNINY